MHFYHFLKANIAFQTNNFVGVMLFESLKLSVSSTASKYAISIVGQHTQLLLRFDFYSISMIIPKIPASV